MIAWSELAGRVNEDGEFRYAARHWDATLRLDMGDASHRLRFEDGSLVARVEPNRERTLYARLGDVPMLLVAIGLVLQAVLLRRRR